MVATILKPVKGSLQVRVPYHAANRQGFKDLGLRPQWKREGQYWQVARDKFGMVICALANGLGLVDVTIEGRHTDQCDTRCQSATGDDCVCACAGQNHGQLTAGWILVSDTTLIQSAPWAKTYRVSGPLHGPTFKPRHPHPDGWN